MIEHSPQHKALIIPDGVQLDWSKFSRHEFIQGYHIVPDDLRSCQIITQAGLDVPSPIVANYKWPGRFVPFAHQVKTAAFLTLNRRAYVFNDIGTGKTMSALWAADYLLNCGAHKSILIVSPLSTLWMIWRNNIMENFPRRTVAVLHGSSEKRIKLLDQPHDFYIINHDGLAVVRHQIYKRRDISLVIVDEGAVLRNARTDGWKVMWSVAGPETRRDIWWMTGSPMPNGPEDVWAQARIVRPDLVDKYFTRFRESVMTKIGMWKWVPRPGWQERCYAMMQPAIRFVRDECIDLPDLVMEYREVVMSKEQEDAYKKMKNDLIVEVNEGKVTAANEAVKMMKLVQIAAGAVYDNSGKVIYLDCRNKLAVLWDTFLESGRKLIIFVPFVHTLELLAKWARDKYIDFRLVFGDVAAKRRSEIFNEFQRGVVEVIIAHPETMAHGLDLTAAHTIVWWSPHYSGEIYSQANGRITRPGQKCKQTIVNLCCSDVERKVYKRLEQKEKMQGLLLGLLK